MITPEDFQALTESHWAGGDAFNGYDHLGYVGHFERNYVTDAWVIDGANALGWTLWELDEWMISTWGRFALERDTMDAARMQAWMAECDMDELVAEGISDVPTE